MLASDDLPDLAPETTIALLGLVVVFWFFARIQIIRRELERGKAETEIPRAPRWLVRLGQWGPIYLVLAVAAVGFAALLAISLR